MDQRFGRTTLRQLSTNPYLYGTDISSSSLLKKQYQEKWPDTQSNYSVAFLDTEADVIDGTDEIIIVTLAMNNTSYVYVQQSFLGTVAQPSNIHSQYNTLINRYLKDYLDLNTFKWEIYIGNSEIDIINKAFEQLHKWKPDYVAIWNMSYDIPKIMDACKRAEGAKPGDLKVKQVEKRLADLFSDPSVPEPFRRFKWVPGKTQKVTASGKVIPINPAAQWHAVVATSSFTFVDAMSAYKLLRTGQPEERSYKLNVILDKVLGIRKLNFEEAGNLQDLEWHKFMQANYKLLYTLYGQFDTISMELMDKKTKDLSVKLPVWSGVTDTAVVNKQPKISADNLHFFCLENNHVVATVGNSDDDDEEEDLTLGLGGWVLCLAASKVKPMGLKVIAEDPEMVTNIRGHGRDLDKVSSYPSALQALNVSKATTSKELISIGQIPKEVARLQNINLLSGHVNAIEYCCTMMNFPTPTDMLRELKRDLAAAA